LKSDARKWSEHTRSAGPGFHSFFVTGSILRTATRHFCLKSAFFGNKCPPFLFRQQGTQQYCGILRCTGQNNQLTVINAHVGYVLFTVVMTTFTVAPSSGVPYADALLTLDLYTSALFAVFCRFKRYFSITFSSYTAKTVSQVHALFFYETIATY